MSAPIICFGQQPCGFFPKRYLYSKIVTARRLRDEIGGEIIFFLHDSDHDPRETQTVLTHAVSGEHTTLNFAFASKAQRKWSPLFCKQVPPDWREKLLRQLPAYVEASAVEAFREAEGDNVADFCLDIYRRMGLLEGVRIVRSSNSQVRTAACEIPDFFVDVAHEGNIVRARWHENGLRLHQGGESYLQLPEQDFTKAQISPTRDTRLRWMQSVIGCTHYVAGAGELGYLITTQTPEITFVTRDPIERADEAYTHVDP